MPKVVVSVSELLSVLVKQLSPTPKLAVVTNPFWKDVLILAGAASSAKKMHRRSLLVHTR